MAWVSGLPISIGELAGQFIGFSNMGYGGGADYNINVGDSGRFSSQQLEWSNTEFSNQIDISEFFAPDHADFDIELAGVNIVDENKNVSARFVCRLSKSGNQWHLNNRLENPSGVVIAYIMRSQSGNTTLAFDPTGNYASGIWKAYLALSVTTSGTDKGIAWAVNFSQCGSKYGNYYFGKWGYGGSGFHESELWDTFGIAGKLPDEKKKSPEFGKSSEPDGGYNPDGSHGTFDDSSDIIPVPHLPTKGVTSAGFINVYVIGDNDLQTLGEKLFPHFLPAELLADPSQLSTPEMLAIILKSFFGTMVSPVGTTIELADNLGIIDILMNGKLIDYVLDCHIIPTAISGATVEGLKVGYRQFNDLQLAKATTDYVEIDCGSLSIGEYWANFLDYSCTVKLFLPFVGFVPIDNEYWNGGTIKVVYHFNIIDGSFQAYVVSTSSKSELQDTVIGQYGGVCCVHMPITGLQYSNVVAGLVNGTAGAVAKAGEGNVAGAVTNAMNMAMLRPDAPSSNGYNASSSFLSERVPYLLIERPASQFSEMYNKEIGLPLNVMCQLSTVHGFTVIDNPVLSISCSDAEYQELVSLLKNGVIF